MELALWAVSLVIMKKTSVQEFADELKDNPKRIIVWAKSEIREYEKLIKILERRLNGKKN